ncbi:MAG: amidohydrolase [Burkholderiales bacterium]|nr:amidohydrolase [Burkholderiales bacterium]
MIMYTSPARRDRFTRQLGLEPARSAQARSMDMLLAEMDRAGVGVGVVQARFSDFFGSVSNDDVAAICREYPGRFVGIAAIDPTGRRAAIAEIDRMMAAGFRGVNVEPGAYPVPMYPDDRRLYPVYAHCEDRGIPVIIMAGGNAGPDVSYSFPVHVDRVAGDFPALKIVVSHGGWPWVSEILHVAFRRENVYVSPDMYLHEAPGWEDYLRAANGFLAERFLYASCYPLAPVEEYAEWFRRLPLESGTRERALWRNAAALLGLPGSAGAAEPATAIIQGKEQACRDWP